MTVKEYFEILKGISGGWCQSELIPPKTIEQISKFESDNNIHIPESYKEWLFLSNGGYLFGRYVHLYGIDNLSQPTIGNDFSNGMVPDEYIILGYMESEHICYDKKTGKFFFYEYVKPVQYFNDFSEILAYIIDICLN